MVIVFVALGLLITLLAGRRQLRLIEGPKFLTTKKPDTEIIHHTITSQGEDQLTRRSFLHSLESSTRSFAAGAVHFGQTLTFLEGNQTISSEQTPLLPEDELLGESGELVGPQSISVRGSYGTTVSSFTCSGQENVAETALVDVSEEGLKHLNTPSNNAEHIVITCSKQENFATLEHVSEEVSSEKDARTNQPCCGQNFKAKVVFISLSVYFVT